MIDYRAETIAIADSGVLGVNAPAGAFSLTVPTNETWEIVGITALTVSGGAIATASFQITIAGAACSYPNFAVNNFGFWTPTQQVRTFAPPASTISMLITIPANGTYRCFVHHVKHLGG